MQSCEERPIVKIAFLDVGQGDTIVVSCPATREAIVVDCVDADTVLEYLNAEQIIYLRGILITHLHADHYSGVPSLLDKYHLVPDLQECEVVAFNHIPNNKNVDMLLRDSDNHSGGTKRSLNTFLRNLNEWFERGEQKPGASRCASLWIERRSLPIEGTLARSIELVHPYKSHFTSLETEGLNNISGVLRINGPGSSALLTGDLELKGWLQIQARRRDLHCDVLKFPHHGAWRSGDAGALLDSLDPSVVVISVGTEGTRYNHPNTSVFDALQKRPHIRLLCTQATEQCQPSIQDTRDAVIKCFELQSIKNGSRPIRSQCGCPCAGTVIIELGDEVRVLQPEQHFHRNVIIETYFKKHRCNWKSST
jgi:beta-lactamase superfamily II metal-dependent hydrolase